MIKAHFFHSGDALLGFEVSGHAGYAQKGHDIVCACVSSAVQLTANTVTEVIGAGAHITRRGGKVALRLIGGDGRILSASDAIKGLRLQLSILSRNYRGTISIEDSEV